MQVVCVPGKGNVLQRADEQAKATRRATFFAPDGTWLGHPFTTVSNEQRVPCTAQFHPLCTYMRLVMVY
jgi:hypothetical protein